MVNECMCVIKLRIANSSKYEAKIYTFFFLSSWTSNDDFCAIVCVCSIQIQRVFQVSANTMPIWVLYFVDVVGWLATCLFRSYVRSFVRSLGCLPACSLALAAVQFQVCVCVCIFFFIFSWFELHWNELRR